MDIKTVISDYPLLADEGLQTYCKRVGEEINVSWESLKGKIRRLSEREYGDSKSHNIESLFREFSSVQSHNNLDSGKKTMEVDGDTLTHTYKGTRRITSEAEAIEFFNVDMDKYKVERLVVNSWDVSAYDRKNDTFTTTTNYQVKITFISRLTDEEEMIKEYKSNVLELTDNILKAGKSAKSNDIIRGVGVGVLSDFHSGRDTNTDHSKPFNFDVLCNHLDHFVYTMNSRQYQHVDINILGDLLESWSGLNHMNTWKILDKFGSKAFIQLCEYFADNVLLKINNLRSVNVVGGNHDRTSISWGVDQQSEVASLFVYVMSLKLPDSITLRYDPVVLAYSHDGTTKSILSHGDNLRKASIEAVLLKYGRGDHKFLMYQTGHLHTRKANKPFFVDTKGVITADDMRYRHIIAPPLCFPAEYAKRLGVGSPAGYIIWEPNAFGTINLFDYAF